MFDKRKWNDPELPGEREMLESRIKSELEQLNMLIETLCDYENFTEMLDLRITEIMLRELNNGAAKILTDEHNRRAKAGIVPKL